MHNDKLSSGDRTARRLQQLSKLFQQGGASEVTERTLDKVLAHETELCRQKLAEIQADLRDLEQRYYLTSDLFFQRYQAGETDDRMDYVEWASLIQMADRLQQRLHFLVNEEAA